MRYLCLLGRVFYAAIFILSASGNFTSAKISSAASLGVPLAEYLVPLAGVTCFLGGMSILLGYKAKRGAWLIVLFLLPVTFFVHPFWQMSDVAAANAQYNAFLKNLSLIGAALLIAYFGSGPFSLDKNR